MNIKENKSKESQWELIKIKAQVMEKRKKFYLTPYTELNSR